MVSKIRPNSNRALSCEESEIRDTAFISKCLFSLILTKKIPPPYADETLESRLPRGWDTDLEFLSIRDIRGGESKKGQHKTLKMILPWIYTHLKWLFETMCDGKVFYMFGTITINFFFQNNMPFWNLAWNNFCHHN